MTAQPFSGPLLRTVRLAAWLLASVILLPIAAAVTILAYIAYVARPFVATIATCVLVMGGAVCVYFVVQHQWANSLRAGILATAAMVTLWGCEWVADRVGRQQSLWFVPPWWWYL